MENVRKSSFPSFGWVGLMLLLMSVMLSAVPGCGKGGPARPRLYAVKGELFVKGQPAGGARVILHPLENADPAAWPTGYPRALVNADGTFTIGTFDDRDGAPVGKYKVLAIWLTGGVGDEEDPNYVAPTNQIDPVTYNDPTQTPWEIEVKAEKNQLPKFEVP